MAFAAKHHVRAVTRTFPLSELNALVGEYHNAEGAKYVIDMLLQSR